MAVPPRHIWLAGATRPQWEQAAGQLDLPAALAPAVDAHRRLRGPYTAGGTIARAVVPAALAVLPDLVAAHEIELLSFAPELKGVVPAAHETLTSLAIPAERTRFYSPKRTQRLANGFTEFLRDLVAADPDRPRSVFVGNAEAADQTDQELLAIMLRRLDPAVVTIVVATGTEPAAWLDAEPLRSALSQYAERVRIPALPPGPPAPPAPAPGAAELARRAAGYVDSDCLSEAPELRAAYQLLPPAERAALHDRRAHALERAGEWSYRLGAIPYHRERGSDRTGAGVKALHTALDYCVDMGYYHATIDAGERGRAIIGPSDHLYLWWVFTTKMTTSLSAMGRTDESEALYEAARATNTDPLVQLQGAYATAMIYTRHRPPPRRDGTKARGWINIAIALSELLPDPAERAFNTVFNYNGLALIELHAGNLEEALRLVGAGLDHLDQELEPGKHRLHRSVLRHNRAQVLAALGRLDEALADYTDVIGQDPNHPEYYFDRAAVLRRLGREADAFADYETAMRLGPPFPELYYNRADLRAATGDLAGALADFGYVLELDPSYPDARVNRAGILIELGDAEGARRDVEAGLALAPDHPYLLCLLGRLELDAQRLDAARAALDAALAADGTLAEAWATRAEVRYTLGDPEGALADLDRALEHGEDPAILYNRGKIKAAMRRWPAAARDFGRVLELTPGELDALLGRGVCRRHLGDEAGAQADAEAVLLAAPDRYAEVAAQLPSLVPGGLIQPAPDEAPLPT